MQVFKEKDYGAMSLRAAQILASQIVLKPDSVLGLATGSSPLGLYKKLVEWHQKDSLDFSGITTINLDEYKGLSPGNPQSYRYFMRTNLFDHINIPQNSTILPDGLAEDAEKECARYDEIIRRAGGIDLQLLGLGYNGHIGFNEPGAAFQKNTHCVSLTQSTVDANKRFFDREEDVPKQAYTMGIGAIMQAKRVVVVICGEEKAEIVRKAFQGPITPQVPASILQLHSNLILVGDQGALGAMV